MALKNAERSYWKLDTIPPELFLHICSFLSAKFVINVLSEVCQQFKDIIDSDTTWRMRISERWPKRYPIVPPKGDFDWKEACIAREEHFRLWQNSGEKMKMYHVPDSHYGSVHVILIVEDGHLCASGARDRTIKVWNLDHLNQMETGSSTTYNECVIATNDSAHNGWVWSMAYDPDRQHLYSGSFDENIKMWNIDSLRTETSTCNLSSPVLCLAFSDNTLVSGSYNREVNVLDPRAALRPLFKHTHHKKPVLCVAATDKFIISGSEDQTIVVYNKVAGKVQEVLQLSSFPMSMSYQEGYILIGDVAASLHVIDPTDEKFELVKSYASGHKEKVTGIHHSLGSIITCSTDKTIRILEPNNNPEPITILNCSGQVAKISSYKMILASANTDDSVTFWLPNEE